MTNPHEATCPSCEATICLRCIALEKRLDPDGLDGCEDCERGVKRTLKARAAHLEKDHDTAAPAAGGRDDE